MWFNIRMRLIDLLNKPKEKYNIGWKFIERIGKL